MCNLNHNGGTVFWAAICGLGIFAVGATLAAPALPSQGSQNLPSDQLWHATDEDPLFLIRSVAVNGRAWTAPPNESLRLPARPTTTTITFGPNPQAANIPLRFRCQLDGFEQEWHERTALMRILIRFIDANQRDIADQVFEVRGESPGWTGSFTDSPWVRRKEVITVPVGADRFWVVMSSAGPPEAVGAFAIRNLVVLPVEGGTNEIRLIPPVKRDASKAAVEAMEVSPAGWGRSGIRPADARLLRYGPGEDVALAILDDHPPGHADWGTAKVQGARITPGQKLTFAWEEVYSIGVADYGRADYMNLPAGLYRFRMEELDLMGVPTGRGFSRLVIVPVAAWKTLWFWVAIGVALFGMAAVGWRLAESRRMKRQVMDLERQRALEQERFRIAQDIHDDLGARVAQISLLSSTAQEKESLSVAEAREELGLVSRMSRELVAALYETVWAVSPENDHLDSLVSYISQVADQMCAVASIKCRFEIQDMPPAIFIAGPVRHNVIMAVKEALHNVITHGRASEIQIGIRKEQDVLRIQVSDNGCGFDPGASGRGNGLDNMERRLRSIGGRCAVASQPGVGTKVTLEFPLPIS
jgi:signal transduction histidine kinase